MSKLIEKLKAAGIFNPHNFAGHGNVFIYYKPADTGRGCMPAWWAVMRVGYQTDPDAAWYAYGNKTFGCLGREAKAQAFEDAKAWASRKYGIKEWARTPFGSWMDAEFVKDRIKELTLPTTNG